MVCDTRASFKRCYFCEYCFVTGATVTRRAAITAKHEPISDTKRVTRWVLNCRMRNPIVVATKNCPKNICMQSSETAFPVMSLSSGQGLDNRIPASYNHVIENLMSSPGVTSTGNNKFDIVPHS